VVLRGYGIVASNVYDRSVPADGACTHEAARVSLVRWSIVVVALIGFVAFLPALDANFVNWDDDVSFLLNHHYRGLGPAQLRWMFTTTLLGHWSPLTWLTWSVNYAVNGIQPFGYHLLSLLLHVVNIALFAVVARRLLALGFGMAPSSVAIVAGATLAALAFGVHPLRAESVAWISGRRDVLCASFYLAATLAYLRGVAGDRRISSGWCAISIATFAAALLAKASAMTLPLTLLLLDVYPLRRRHLGWPTMLIEKLPYAVLAAAAAVMALIARQEGGSITDYTRYGLGARIALSAYTFCFYPWKSLWPTGLTAGYELPVQISLLEPRFAVALVAVVAITGLLIFFRRGWPGGLAAWLASMIVLAPVSGTVHSGVQLVADRYSYLSCFGFAILAGAALVWAIRRGATRAAAAVAVVMVSVLTVTTWKQAATWYDSETLWRHAVAVDPACALCMSNLGRVIARPGHLDEAEAYIARAIALRPDRPGPHENMGTLLFARGRLAEAEAQFREVVRLRPHHGPSHNNLGAALAQAGRDAEAEVAFRAAARLSPGFVDAPANLGALYLRQRRFDEAVPALRHALALDPTRRAVQENLERALARREL
jgi:Tfp pilus assembly protein PilF